VARHGDRRAVVGRLHGPASAGIATLHYGPNYLGDLGFDPWLAAIAVGVVTYGGAMYGVYYNIIVGVGSANSQDYAGRFDVVPGGQPNSVRLRPGGAPSRRARERPAWLAAVTNLRAVPGAPATSSPGAALAVAVIGWTQLLFGMLRAGRRGHLRDRGDRPHRAAPACAVRYRARRPGSLESPS